MKIKKSELKEIIKEEFSLNEMAKISGDLKTAIEKVINDNPDLEGLALKKAIKANDAVEQALQAQDAATLYDNQLNKFIALAKGERTVGQRGRKADPNKKPAPKKTGGKRGRPAGIGTPKKKDTSTIANISKLEKSYTAGKDGDEPSDADLRKLAATGGPVGGDKTQQLRAQERSKMLKAFYKVMQKQGIMDKANRVLDKDAYTKAFAKVKPEIDKKVAAINESKKN